MHSYLPKIFYWSKYKKRLKDEKPRIEQRKYQRDETSTIEVTSSTNLALGSSVGTQDRQRMYGVD